MNSKPNRSKTLYALPAYRVLDAKRKKLVSFHLLDGLTFSRACKMLGLNKSREKIRQDVQDCLTAFQQALDPSGRASILNFVQRMKAMEIRQPYPLNPDFPDEVQMHAENCPEHLKVSLQPWIKDGVLTLPAQLTAEDIAAIERAPGMTQTRPGWAKDERERLEQLERRQRNPSIENDEYAQQMRELEEMLRREREQQTRGYLVNVETGEVITK